MIYEQDNYILLIFPKLIEDIMRMNNLNKISLVQIEIEKGYISILGTPSDVWKAMSLEHILHVVRDKQKLSALGILLAEEAFCKFETNELDGSFNLLRMANGVLSEVMNNSSREEKVIKKYLEKLSKYLARNEGGA